MEQCCISHRELEGFKALAPTWWIPAWQQISHKRQAIIAEAKRVFRIRELSQGYATEVEPLMKQVWSAYLSEFGGAVPLGESGGPEAARRLARNWNEPDPGSTIRLLWKVTGDALEVMNDGTLHNELMIVLLHCQVPQRHFSVAVYAGKDDHNGLRDNVGSVLEEFARISETGLVVEHSDGGTYTVLPDFVLPSNMATHWGLYGCGGTKDNHFCHRCTTHHTDRAKLYEWITLPECPTGDSWTVQEAAAFAKMHSDDVIYLNSQTGAKEENLQHHHVTFKLPPSSKPYVPDSNISLQEQEAIK
eukprot:730880-Rhodomonas_salina.1